MNIWAPALVVGLLTLGGTWLGLHYGRKPKAATVPVLDVHRVVEFQVHGKTQRFIVTHIEAGVPSEAGALSSVRVELQDEASLIQEHTLPWAR